MAAGTPEYGSGLAAALLGNHQWVEPAPAHVPRETAALAQRVPDSGEEIGPVGGQPACAFETAGLFIRQHGDHHIARRRPAVAEEPERGQDHHGHAALHVDGAASPDVAVNDLAGEGRTRPGLAGRRDDVDVPLQQQRRRLPASGQPRHQVGPGIAGAGDHRLQPGIAQQALQMGHAAGLVARRVGGVEADQLLGQLGDRGQRDHSIEDRTPLASRAWAARPRWLQRCFSAGGNSAKVRPRSGSRKIGS